MPRQAFPAHKIRLTIEEAAEYLGVDESTIRTYVQYQILTPEGWEGWEPYQRSRAHLQPGLTFLKRRLDEEYEFRLPIERTILHVKEQLTNIYRAQIDLMNDFRKLTAKLQPPKYIDLQDLETSTGLTYGHLVNCTKLIGRTRKGQEIGRLKLGKHFRLPMGAMPSKGRSGRRWVTTTRELHIAIMGIEPGKTLFFDSDGRLCSMDRWGSVQYLDIRVVGKGKKQTVTGDSLPNVT